MGDRGTFKSGDSMSSHSKDSMSIITRIVNASKESWKYIPEKDVYVDAGTFVDLDYRTFMTGFEHIRETIEEWEVMCDELDGDISELRKTIETLAGNCPYRNEYCDASDCAGCKYARINILARQMCEIQQLTEDCDRFRELAISRNKELEQEREKSNQLEKECSSWEERCTELKKELSNLKELCRTWQEESAKDYKKSKQLKEELSTVRAVANQVAEEKANLREELAKKGREIADLIEERDYYQDCLHKLANRASNFCGNCKYFSMHSNDVGMCKHPHVIARSIDPDDASCPCFESNQVDRDKPDQPCCKACNREDCDNCTLCPF